MILKTNRKFDIIFLAQTYFEHIITFSFLAIYEVKQLKSSTFSFSFFDKLVRSRQLIPTGLNTPNFASILGNSTIAREFAGGSNVVNAHLHPDVLIL